ncbi:MAG: AAA family ATPase, partial [Gammaproteobacteria bacterium]|nr:AAA family ATPase [Gammaproteobacteria bacterium]
MAEKILIIGPSGSGKSTSTQYLDEKEVFYINTIGKPLPFEGWKGRYKQYNKETKEGNLYASHNWETVIKLLTHISDFLPEKKIVIIDDAQYIMSYEFMERAEEKGWDKFTEIGKHMFDVLISPDNLRDDLSVIFMSHSVDDTSDGLTKTKMKTIGKMLDEKITIEGLFSIVLLSVAYKNETTGAIEYVFVTKTNGNNVVKTPAGMFKDKLIP